MSSVALKFGKIPVTVGTVRKRRLSGSQLDDLVHRAMTDKRFDLSAASDEFADYFLDEAEAAGWAEELERSNKARHLFNASALETAKPEQKFGGHTQAELEKMPPQQVLS
jgi:hypothetical protein